MKWRILENQRGSALLIIAAGLATFLGFAAIVLDVGSLYLARSRLANAVDAAALAGAQELPAAVENALEQAAQVAVANGVDEQGLTLAVSEDRHAIKVEAVDAVPLYFARIFGLSTATVSAKAEAVVGAVQSVKGVVPLGIEQQDFVFGELYTLKEGGGNGTTGNFGGLSFGMNGASRFREYLRYGYPKELSIGDVIESEPGNMSGPTQVLQERINACHHVPRCTPAQFARDCPRIILVPIIDQFGNGRSDVTIVGFAAFFLEEVGGNGNHAYITGRFLQTVTSGEIGDPSADFGLRAVKLIH